MNKAEAACLQNLFCMSNGHVEVMSASANHKSALHMAAKDTGKEKITFLGGQTKVRVLFENPGQSSGSSISAL